MDNLYDNLENYHDEKLMNELRSENKELKDKLEKYSSDMARLQTDFEKLSSEYKNLETNYSSLLRTARSEIERKTEMIKNLNLEKDKLVLETLQRPARNILTNRPEDDKKSDKYVRNTQGTEVIKEPSYKKDGRKNSINNRIDSPHSEEAVLNLESSSLSSEDKRLRKSKNYKRDELCNTKEIRKEEMTQSRDSKDGKNLKSRNSVPSQFDVVFSSDDDFESLDLKNRRFLSARDNTSYRDRYNKSKDHRFTESYNSQYLDSSNKFYRNQTITSSDNDIYKNERYEFDNKYRTHPREKYTYHKKEYHQPRGDCDKQRVLRSPPSNKYKRSRSRDSRVNFEREDYRDYDRKSPHYNEILPLKYDIRNEFDEPSSKRQKRYIHDNTEPQYIVKGSKHTAPSLVESTEGLSKKCLRKKNETKAVSQTKPLPIAENSKHENKKSLQVTEEIISTINNDIDNSELNLSLESGEIPSLASNENAAKTCENLLVQKNQERIPQSNSNKNVDNLLIEHTNSSTNPVYKIPKIKHSNKDYLTNENTNIGTNITDNVPSNVDTKICKEKSLIVKLEKCNIDKLQNALTQNEQIITNIDRKNEEINTLSNNLCLPENVTASLNTLAGDLELSDDGSDNKDSHDISENICNKKTKKNIKEKEISTSINLNRNPNKLPSPQTQMKDNKSIQIKKSVISKKNTDKKCVGDNKTKQKIKKKVEQNDTNCSKIKKQNQDAKYIIKPSDEVCERVNLSPTNSKLNEIFVDNSSLITPDDLGILPVQVPLVSKFDSDFDKVQDAVNVSVEILSELQSDGTNAFSEIGTEKSSIGKNTNPMNITTKANTDNNVTDIKHSLSKFYENAKSEILDDAPNVVKTIVISTGVQPNCLLEKTEFQNTQNDDAGLDNINNAQANTKKSSLNKIKALATSTPQKAANEISLLPKEPTNADKVNNEINLSSNMSNSSSLVLDEVKTKNETDEPDLRIFVKRRRKVIKKV